MTALPTRDELHEMVEMEFREKHPSAPERLDPDQSSHAGLIASWVAIRDRKVVEWTDDVFASFFPDAGKLDPSDPRDKLLIGYWRDIHDQIRDGPPGKYDWTSWTPTSAAEFRQLASGSDEPDPVIPDATDAIKLVRQSRDMLVEMLAGTDLADRVSSHIDDKIGDMVRANGEGEITEGEVWKSEALTANAPNPDLPDDPYFVRDLQIQARLDGVTFTIEAGVTGSAQGPNGTFS